MEYCGLGSVQDAMNILSDKEGDEEGNFGLCEEDIAYIVKSVVSGLAYLHSQKIIHRYQHIFIICVQTRFILTTL